jgi:hypothetical protein
MAPKWREFATPRNFSSAKGVQDRRRSTFDFP